MQLCQQNLRQRFVTLAPLDSLDVTLRVQRMFAYGERLHREEGEVAIIQPAGACQPARPCKLMARQQLHEVAEKKPHAPPMADAGEDVRAVGRPRPLRAEERIYIEPWGLLK